jgi:hypothetical protein
MSSPLNTPITCRQSSFYRASEMSLFTCWNWVIVEGSGELIGGGGLGVRDVTEVTYTT